MTAVEPHLRSDARRNLERILEAARAVFGERGMDATVGDIAERAGVGTATIFRRFPTKDDLCLAVIESELDTMVSLAEQAASLEELITRAVERIVADRCLCDAAGSELFERPQIVALRARVSDAVGALLTREQATGAVRGDVTTDDIAFLVNAMGQAGIQLEQATPGAWRRYVELSLSGLRPR